MRKEEIIKQVFELTFKPKNQLSDIENIACSYFFVKHPFYSADSWRKYKDLIYELLNIDEEFLFIFNGIQENYGVVGLNDIYDPNEFLDY